MADVGTEPIDYDPFAVEPVDHDPFATAAPKNDDAAQAEAAREAAAARVRQAVFPEHGRQEGVATDVATKFIPALVHTATQPIIEGADLMRRAATEGNVTSEHPEDIAKAFNAAGVAAAGAMPFAERGALGAFGGMPTYSAAGEAVRSAKAQVMHPQQWLGYLKNQPGVKAQELEHIGLEDWLKAQKGPVRREAVDEFVQSKQPELAEVRKGGGAPVPDALVGEINGWLEHKYGPPDANAEVTPADLDALRHHRDAEVIGRLEGLGVPWDLLKPLYEEAPTKHSSYQLPGGSSYGETLLTLPDRTASPELAAKNIYESWGRRGGDPSWEELPARDQTEFIRMAKEQGLKQGTKEEYKSSHWDEPNVLLHVRHNDRMVPGPNGEPVPALHLEEIQSDWHQAGRKYGYKDNQPLTTRLQPNSPYGSEVHEAVDSAGRVVGRGFSPEAALEAAKGMPSVPDAPFKTTWPDLALKRMLHRAATERNPDGSYKYQALSWTPGEAQAARYDLSKQVEALHYQKNTDGTYRLSAQDLNGRGHLLGDEIPENELEKHIGKEVSEKIANGQGKETNLAANNAPPYVWKKLSGLDLKVGGEGMKSFYDKMLVDKANALTKKYGTRVKPNQQIATQTEIPEPVQTRMGAWAHGSLPGRRFGSKSEAEDALREALPKTNVHILPITPELRAAAERGFPTFAAGGAVHRAEGGRNPLGGTAVNMPPKPDLNDEIAKLAQAAEAEDISTSFGRVPDEQGTSTYQPKGMYARRVKAENRGSRIPEAIGKFGDVTDSLAYPGKGEAHIERAAGGRVEVKADGLFEEPDKPDWSEIARNQHEAVEHFNYADRFVGNKDSYDPKGDYNCGRCNQALGIKCLLLDITKIDRKAGSCEDWERLNAQRQAIHEKKDKDAASYGVAANGEGFGCHRCPFSRPAKNRDSKGRNRWCAKIGFYIEPKGCCTANGAKLSGTDVSERAQGGRVMPKIDLTHDVRWMSDMSRDGTVFYADRSLPRFIMNNGKRLEVIRPLIEHEVAEFAHMQRHRSEAPAKVYADAHKHAGIPAERKWIEDHGFLWKDWESWCRGKLASLEKKKAVRPPPHPDVRQVPHGRGDLEFTGRAEGGRVQSHLAAADEALGLTKEEGDLYKRHLTNLWGRGGVDNPDGSRSSLYQAVVEHGGRYYNIPTVREGKILPIPEAEDAAHAEGIDKFPSYATPEEADARYDQMHGFMEQDTGDYFNSRRAEGGAVDLPVMVDPIAGQRSVGERPDVQEFVKDYAKGVLDPLGRVGRIIMGRSQEPFQDAALAAIGMVGPPGAAAWKPAAAMAGKAFAKGAHHFARDVRPEVPTRASGGRVDAKAINHNPTPAQAEAGNYAKDTVYIHGLRIKVENAKGSIRRGVDKNGKPWEVVLPYSYGYLSKTEGADGDHVDVLLGPHLRSRKVFIIDQHDADTGRWDEHKTGVGWGSAAQFRHAYLKGFSDGKGKDRLRHMTEMSIEQFRDWLHKGDTTKPAKNAHATNDLSPQHS